MKNLSLHFGGLAFVGLAALPLIGCESANREARPPENLNALPQKHPGGMREALPRSDAEEFNADAFNADAFNADAFGKAEKNPDAGAP